MPRNATASAHKAQENRGDAAKNAGVQAGDRIMNAMIEFATLA
jgi:hypothetical protein